MKRVKQRILVQTMMAVTLGSLTVQTFAQQDIDNEQNKESVLEEVVVTGTVVGNLDLMSKSETGSRLGLSAFETPASINVIDSDTMRARGFLSVTEAADSMVGVNSGENPGGPAAFSMRGFTDNQITTLRNGIRIGAASMVTRPQNTFNLERVEILKGPASVLYGEGSVAGTVNAVSKKPKLGAEAEWDFLTTYGSYNTYQAGVGFGGSFTENTAYRLDASRNGSDGWVNDTPSDSTNVTGSVLTAFTDSFLAMVSFDYLTDNLPNNWGQPLLPDEVATQPLNGVIDTPDGRSIDKRNRFTNYNVGDDKSESDGLWLNLNLDWEASESLTIRDELYHYSADRKWQNAEQYIWDNSIEMITRDRFYVSHDQSIIGNRLNAIYHGHFGAMENTFLAGIDLSKIEFTRIKSFPDGDAVDLFNPIPGVFGALLESKKAEANISTTALYFEDTLAVTPKFRLVVGGRQERLKLDRDDYGWTADLGGGEYLDDDSFENTFNSFSWRAGLVYDVTPDIATYAQFTTGKDPVGTELFSVEASEKFNLASSQMWELGLKASLQDGKTEVTFAYYDILREDLLTQIGQDEVANIGSQQSKGFEFSTSTSLTENWQASMNLAYTDASYGDVFIPFLGDATGNTPPNVGKWTANAWTSVSNIGGLPLEIGGGVRYIDDRYADVSNVVTLKSYVLFNAYVAYNYKNYRVMLRSRNLTNEDYVPWVNPFYINQVALGSPRTVELSLEGRF